jgi:thioredoxin reductase
MTSFDQRTEFQWLELGIIGSGPAGLSAAAHAAEIGVSHVLLEAEDHPSNTIHKYQKGKHVMAEPQILPLRSPLSFGAGKRETVLETWTRQLAEKRVNIRYNCEVASVSGKDGNWELKTKSGETFFCRKVVLAIGLQGNLRKLGVPGESLAGVQYQLDDPDEYRDETIIVVGAGDAAIENALALAPHNRVILVNRNEEFARCKEGNLSLVLDAIKQGRLECRYGTSALKVESVPGPMPLQFSVKTPSGPDVIECNRIIARLGATPPRKLVESFGVKFPSPSPPRSRAQRDVRVEREGHLHHRRARRLPAHQAGDEPGLRGGGVRARPPIAPADEPLLAEKLARFSRSMSVRRRSRRSRPTCRCSPG